MTQVPGSSWQDAEVARRFLDERRRAVPLGEEQVIYRHWIDGHPTVDVIDLDEKGRKLEGILAVQVHVASPMTIQYKDFYLKVLPDDLPLIKPERAAIPSDPRKVVQQGQDKPRKPDAE